MANKKERLYSILLYVVFGVYLFILLVLLFFRARSFRSINLVPLHYITEYLTEGGVFAVGNVLGNIVLFIPLGVYMAMFLGKKAVLIPTVGVVLVSMAAEIMQYIMQVGVTDIDDVLLNGFGGFLGVILYHVIYKIWKDKAKHVIGILSLIMGVAFITLIVCLYYGVFGIVIR